MRVPLRPFARPLAAIMVGLGACLTSGVTHAADPVAAHGLTAVGSHGVRIFSDLVPSALVDSEADRTALLELEEAASAAATEATNTDDKNNKEKAEDPAPAAAPLSDSCAASVACVP